MQDTQAITLKGMFRVQLEEPNGKIVGDSGWNHNQVSNLGFNQYIVMSLGSIAGSKYLTHVALGTGGTIATDATSLGGEQSVRAALTAATSNTSKTLNLTATFASSASFVTATKNLSNIGLFNTSAGGTIFAANTFASSSCATNQAVNVTYNLTFATA